VIYSEIFWPEYDNNDLPSHVYLKSVHNISIERAWLRLRLEFGNNAIVEYHKGVSDGIFNPADGKHVYVHFLKKETPYSHI
jgi:hypothetical protein